MKAAVVGDRGVVLCDVPQPAPAPNEVLIRVRASSLNRADLIVASGQRHGKLFGTGSRLGLECAGEVEAVGGEVADLKAGDRVMASAPGGFAEYAVTDWGRVHRIPANNMTYEQAACFPVALQTMHNAVMTAGRFKRGETLLIQGASSGVGLMGMQIGKLMGASLVIGTSTNAQRRARLREFNCDLALDSADPKWPEQVKEGTGGKGVDLIVDMVSGGAANQNLEAAALFGRIVNVGRLGGMTGEFNFDLHALKRIDYIGVTFRTRSLDENAKRSDDDLAIGFNRRKLEAERKSKADVEAAARRAADAGASGRRAPNRPLGTSAEAGGSPYCLRRRSVPH